MLIIINHVSINHFGFFGGFFSNKFDPLDRFTSTLLNSRMWLETIDTERLGCIIAVLSEKKICFCDPLSNVGSESIHTFFHLSRTKLHFRNIYSNLLLIWNVCSVHSTWPQIKKGNTPPFFLTISPVCSGSVWGCYGSDHCDPLDPGSDILALGEVSSAPSQTPSHRSHPIGGVASL